MARIIEIKKADGQTEQRMIHDIGTYPYSLINRKYQTSYKHGKDSYYEQFSSFDIETTTIGKKGDDYIYGFMYMWQISMCGEVVVGRRWEELFEWIANMKRYQKTDNSMKHVMYVHNLGYEFQFIRNFLDKYEGGYSVFASQSRKPISVRTKSGIEMRCGYKLTNMSLENACLNEKGIKYHKAVGDLDYRKLRTPDTYIDDTELGYGVLDVLSLSSLVENMMINNNDNIATIPLTSTGYVRRDVRLEIAKYPKYHNAFTSLRFDNELYELMKEESRGGNTHANRHVSGKIIEGTDSYDAVSSYIYQLVCKKFPMSRFTKVDISNATETEIENLLETKACLFRVIIENPEVYEEVSVPYIALAKCKTFNKVKLDNGRILSASHVQVTVTEIDWRIICNQYKMDSYMIYDMWISDYALLPKPIRDTCIDYFKHKCILKKEVKEAENISDKSKYEDVYYRYCKFKNKILAIFGMMYTDPIKNGWYINDKGEWKPEDKNIQKELDKFFNSKNSFLTYAWGIWTTSHARDHLQLMLDLSDEHLTIYCDTDSDKCKGVPKEKVDELNSHIELSCQLNGGYAVVDKKYYYLGVFEKENKEPVKEFITLGAKKYSYVDEKGLHLTISGVSKKTGAQELGNIRNFKEGFKFTKSGGLEMYYNDEEIHEITVDGCTFTTASNIGSIDGEYTIGLTGEYADLIGYEKDYL